MAAHGPPQARRAQQHAGEDGEENRRKQRFAGNLLRRHAVAPLEHGHVERKDEYVAAQRRHGHDAEVFRAKEQRVERIAHHARLKAGDEEGQQRVFLAKEFAEEQHRRAGGEHRHAGEQHVQPVGDLREGHEEHGGQGKRDHEGLEAIDLRAAEYILQAREPAEKQRDDDRQDDLGNAGGIIHLHLLRP